MVDWFLCLINVNLYALHCKLAVILFCSCYKSTATISIIYVCDQEEFYHCLHTWTQTNCLYCCTVHFVDSLNITQPTNALIVYHLF